MVKIVLLRHGESIWNQENRFTGWTDIDLSEKGIEDARQAGKILREKGYTFDIAYSSVLKRAIRTLWIVLEELDMLWLPAEKTWRLNERHYGALQGLNKAEMAKKFGEEQVHLWRRSYNTRPPRLKLADKRHPKHDYRYRRLNVRYMPATESLQDCFERVIPYWYMNIVPRLKKSQRVLISAHGNSLRALLKHIDRISDKEITDLNIPTGIPLVYELDRKLKPTRHYFLGDQKTIKEKLNSAATSKGKIKPEIYPRNL